MTQIIDQTGRPEGHPGFCSCLFCVNLPKVSGAVHPAPLADATTNEVHDLAFEARDLARRTHSWVVFLGVVCILQIMGAIGFGVYAAAHTAHQQNSIKAYVACIEAGSSPAACLVN